MRSIELTRQVLGYPLTVTAIPAGRDWSITILGGCRPHVGSVSLAECSDGTVSLRSWVLPTHQDGIVGELFARRLAQEFHSTVSVTCGIHYEGPSRRDLDHIVSCAEELLEQLVRQIVQAMQERPEGRTLS